MLVHVLGLFLQFFKECYYMQNLKPADTSPTSTNATDEQSPKFPRVKLVEPGTPRTDTSPTNVEQLPVPEDPQGVHTAGEVVRKFMQTKYKEPPR